MTYITRPRSDWEPEPLMRTTITVIEETDEPIYTGLLDANGSKIYRVRDMQPMGFRPR